jgi:hypothetical protein
MSFDTIINEYMVNLQNTVRQAYASNQLTAELSYRPILDNLFANIIQEINNEIEKVFEPRNQSRSGRPDWRFHNSRTLGVYGYVEAKGLNLDQDIAIGDNEEQINRYLALDHRVILTDGLEFIFFEHTGVAPVRISIVPRHTRLDNLTSTQWNPLIENHFRRFFQTEMARRCTEEQLIRDVAKRAVILSANIADLSDLPEEAGVTDNEKQTIAALNRLKQIVENHHDLTLHDRKAFGDFVAQVLVFGLLYAHRVVWDPTDTPRDLFIKMKQFWKDVSNSQYIEQLYPFRVISDLLGDELEQLGPIGTWYEDCALLLAYIDRKSVV